MLENEFLDASEKLTAFIDGELPKEDYGTLFYELAQNSDLQDELSQLILIKSTFHNKLSIAPPLLKNSIMDKVGLGIPTLVERLLSPTLMTTFFSGQWFKFAALSSLMMFFGIVSVNKDNTLSNRYAQQFEIIDESVAQSTIPIMTSADADDRVEIRTQVSEPSTRSSNITTLRQREPILSDRAMPLKPDDTSVERVAPTSYEFMPIGRSAMFNPNYYGIALDYGRFQKLDSRISTLGRFLTDFSISLKTFNGASFPNFNISRYNEPLINNFSIGINYKLSKNHFIGLAYGQENFLMQFDQLEGDIIYTYNQSFNSNWIAGTYKYKFSEIANSGVFPEFNLLAGATQVGPVAKVGGGLAYLLTDNFMLNLGLEYSLLMYPIGGDWRNGNWFSTHKIGYSVGMGVNF